MPTKRYITAESPRAVLAVGGVAGGRGGRAHRLRHRRRWRVGHRRYVGESVVGEGRHGGRERGAGQTEGVEACAHVLRPCE